MYSVSRVGSKYQVLKGVSTVVVGNLTKAQAESVADELNLRANNVYQAKVACANIAAHSSDPISRNTARRFLTTLINKD